MILVCAGVREVARLKLEAARHLKTEAAVIGF